MNFNKPITIGVLIIATNKYKQFIQQLIDSIDKYFFRHDKVNIYLFIDDLNFSFNTTDRINIVKIIIPPDKFPTVTLHRYKYFTEASSQIECDYVFYSDSDMRFCAPVDREILPTDTSLVATIHPGFYKGGGSWCTNEKSNAFTPIENRRKYYAGGFNGGKTEGFLTMSKILSELIDKDEANGVMAEWHDEAFFNMWLGIHRCKELTPSYCYPESWHLPFPKRLLALDKDHKAIRK